MTVYLLRNTDNGKGYVGITAGSADRRFRAHCYLALAKKHPRGAIHRAIRKYGPDAFEMSVLATVATWDEAQELDKAFILQEHTFTTESGYNMTRGGEGALGRM